MSVRVYVPGDSAACSVGADEVAARITAVAAAEGVTVEVIRNGSRGMLWLEPFVEVQTPAGRVGYGPVAPGDVEALIERGIIEPRNEKYAERIQARENPKNRPIRGGERD